MPNGSASASSLPSPLPCAPPSAVLVQALPFHRYRSSSPNTSSLSSVTASAMTRAARLSPRHATDGSGGSSTQSLPSEGGGPSGCGSSTT
jgi:hypothetical protein